MAKRKGAKPWEPPPLGVDPKTGQPIDPWRNFDFMLSCHCSLEELAGYYNVSEDTIERAVKRKFKMLFADYSRQKKGAGLANVRRVTFQHALKGNTTLLVVLWKKYLGFTDKMIFEDKGKVSKQQAEAAKEFVTRIETLVGELKAAPQGAEDKEKKMGLLAASLGIRE